MYMCYNVTQIHDKDRIYYIYRRKYIKFCKYKIQKKQNIYILIDTDYKEIQDKSL